MVPSAKSRRKEATAPVVEMQKVREETTVPSVEDVEDLALSSAVKVLVVKVVGSCEAGYVLVPEMASSFEVLKRRIATRFPGVPLANMKKVSSASSEDPLPFSANLKWIMYTQIMYSKFGSRESVEIGEQGQPLPAFQSGDKIDLLPKGMHPALLMQYCETLFELFILFSFKGVWLPGKEGKNDAMLLSEFCENVLRCKPEYQDSHGLLLPSFLTFLSN